MSKKRQKKSKRNAANIALAIAIIDLIGHLVDLIAKMMD